MPNITITKSFKFAERGIDVFEYLEGETVDVSDECAEVAITEGWAALSAPDAPAGKRKTKREPEYIDGDFASRETASASDDIETK